MQFPILSTTYGLMGNHRRDQLVEMNAELAAGEIVCDSGIITSTCPATAVEVALKLLEMLTDADNAARVRQLILLSAGRECPFS